MANSPVFSALKEFTAVAPGIEDRFVPPAHSYNDRVEFDIVRGNYIVSYDGKTAGVKTWLEDDASYPADFLPEETTIVVLKAQEGTVVRKVEGFKEDQDFSMIIFNDSYRTELFSPPIFNFKYPNTAIINPRG
ncbi:MAG: hypothetical protein O2871_00965 [bacterium]|nr:hypothetical protein [bacterium]